MNIVYYAFLSYVIWLSVGIIYNWIILKTKHLDGIKLEGNRATVESFRKRFVLIAFNLVLPAFLVPFSVYNYRHYLSSSWPAWEIAIFQFIVMIVLDDIWTYTSHRLLHENKFLLRTVHSVHHRARNPSPLDFVYVHPVEWFITPFGIMAAGAILVLTCGKIYLPVLLGYLTFRIIFEMHIHSGLRSIFYKYIPIFVDPDFHWTHHEKARGNYSSMLGYLDRVFGTLIR